MRRVSSTQRDYIIIGLCAILLIMVVGYAAFQSQLRISGTSNISSDFAVRITSITPNNIVGNAKDVSGVTTHTDTTATFGTTLELPGDSITYDVVIENEGTIDATLKTITKTDASNSAILFETSGVNEGDELGVGETATMQVKVTYNPSVTSQPDNLESTLKVTLDYEQSDGAIVPSNPTTTFGGQDVEVVSSGDGLYADEYEAGKYTYKGTSLDNYITFNNETWRIISIESDGTIKIMRNASIGKMAFDADNSNAWETSDIKTYLNDTYLSTITTNQDKIVSHTWSIGAVTQNNSDLAGQIADENGVQSQSVSVGLITASEYLRANANIEHCGNMSLSNADGLCALSNWVFNILPVRGSYLLTISPSYSTSSDIFVQFGRTSGQGNKLLADAANVQSNDIYPVVYLSSSTTLSGTGSSSDPYVITN